MEEALWSLLVLLTTANYPDVMMPAYAASRAAVAFFATFEIVGNWFLLNVVLAVVYKGHSDMLQATGPNPIPPPTRTSDPCLSRTSGPEATPDPKATTACCCRRRATGAPRCARTRSAAPSSYWTARGAARSRKPR